MKRTLLAIAAAALIGACDAAPTAAPGTARAAADVTVASTNQAPVADITLYSSKPTWYSGYGGGMRHTFRSTGSYDPDGSITSYFWTTNCVHNPEAFTSGYVVNVYPNEVCLVDLWVYDAHGAWGHDQVKVGNAPGYWLE